jgi:protein-tyrosine phosphatase
MTYDVLFAFFVAYSARHGQGVLVCSVRGQGRAAVAGVALLMYKYRWSFEKAYDFVVSKKADIDINR